MINHTNNDTYAKKSKHTNNCFVWICSATKGCPKHPTSDSVWIRTSLFANMLKGWFCQDGPKGPANPYEKIPYGHAAYPSVWISMLGGSSVLGLCHANAAYSMQMFAYGGGVRAGGTLRGQRYSLGIKSNGTLKGTLKRNLKGT